jgi:hypothetical protein
MKQTFSLCVALLFASFASAIDLQTFESGITTPKGEFFVNNANFASIELVANPNKSGINTSNNVVAVRVHSGNPNDPTTLPGSANSGIIKISFAGDQPVIQYPANPTGADVLYYDRLRFKYYKGSLLNRYVEFEPNGSATSPKTLIQPQGIDEWEYVTIPLENKTYTNFQIRINRNDTGTGSATGTAAGNIIYLDDFELFNSTDGPLSAVPFINEDALFSIKNMGNKSFSLETTLDKTSNVRVDLISPDGRLVNIYNQIAGSHLTLPFNVSAKGIYCVRMTIDNQISKTEKIIAQ